MTTYNISIDNKYFEPIRNGKITLLIFKKKIIHGAEPGDCVIAARGSYDVKAKIVRTYMKSFKEITESEAQRAGFLNKDFLKDELIENFSLKPKYDFDIGNTVDEEIFFLVEITCNEKDYSIQNDTLDIADSYYELKDIGINLYSKDYNKEFYNPEYDIQPWRN